jgi:hypothetical protein
MLGLSIFTVFTDGFSKSPAGFIEVVAHKKKYGDATDKPT